MKKIFLTLVCLLLPSKLAIFFLRVMGNDVSYKSKFGFSILYFNSIKCLSETKIGHFNFIKCDMISLDQFTSIGHFNYLNGPFTLILNLQSRIGNFNKIVRANIGITSGESFLTLGMDARITGGHKLDLTKSITLGDYTTLAGSGSQLWTHGYYHYPEGAERFRVDGEINIGNNVYIGSHVVINAGIKVGKSIIIGSHTCISKSLENPGMYVSQALRFIPVNLSQTKENLTLDTNELCEVVYVKSVK